MTIENLVFEGGGVRGIAYAGALNVLEQRGLLETVRGVAGASAGAFTALMLSLDYSPDEVRDVLRSLHFKSLEDKPNPLRMATHYGLYKGQVLYDWIAKQLEDKGLPQRLTFEELAEQGARDLRVYATDLNLCNTREFSAEKTPKASVVGAVRASMSIPLMYSAWQFPDGIPDDHVYVDGGTVYNYPINAFDTETGINTATMGFCFFAGGADEKASDLGMDNVFKYTQRLFAAVLNAQAIDLNQERAQCRRSVRINDLGYRATDLELSGQGFEALYNSGVDATVKHLDAL